MLMQSSSFFGSLVVRLMGRIRPIGWCRSAGLHRPRGPWPRARTDDPVMLPVGVFVFGSPCRPLACRPGPHGGEALQMEAAGSSAASRRRSSEPRSSPWRRCIPMGVTARSMQRGGSCAAGADDPGARASAPCRIHECGRSPAVTRARRCRTRRRRRRSPPMCSRKVARLR